MKAKIDKIGTAKQEGTNWFIDGWEMTHPMSEPSHVPGVSIGGWTYAELVDIAATKVVPNG